MPAPILPLAALGLLALSMASPAANAARAVNPAAEALAEKFSGAEEQRIKQEAEAKANAAAESKAKAEAEAARRKAAEDDILARARAEAAEREAAAAAAAVAAEQKRAEDERKAAAAAVEAKAAEDHAAAAAKDAAEKAAAETIAAEKAAAERIADESEKAKTAEAAHNARAAEREREAVALSEKLKRVREERPAAGLSLDAPVPPPVASAPVEKRRAGRPEPPASASVDSRFVTVILVMEPGHTGIRRANKTADPVLCVETGCYVGIGSDRSAKWMAKGLALGPLNILGGRAGACRHALSCVFRNVDLGRSRRVQPVDLRYLKHDRREARTVSADRGCTLTGGDLGCPKVIVGKGWRAWIVPEALARDAGPAALDKAAAVLASGATGPSSTPRDVSYRDPMER